MMRLTEENLSTAESASQPRRPYALLHERFLDRRAHQRRGGRLVNQACCTDRTTIQRPKTVFCLSTQHWDQVGLSRTRPCSSSHPDFRSLQMRLHDRVQLAMV